MKQRAKVRQSAGDKSATRFPDAGPHENLPRAAAIGFVVAASLICLGYSIYTQQIWEDSLITLRQSENLLKGEGLTFNTGGRVHGFTSPINVILLAVCHLVTGQISYVYTIWLYRVFSIAAYAASGVLLLKTLYETPPRWNAALWFVAIAYLFDVKTIAFCTNGMETAFVLVFLAWAVYLMSRSDVSDWRVRGLCWAGLMWSRPDACVYIAALALGELVFLSSLRRATIVSFARSAAVCAAVYGPWILWAWVYYGSPIPHTITAKGNAEMGWMPQFFAASDEYPSSILTQASQAFRPIYYGSTPMWIGHLGWGRLINGVTKIVALIGLMYWLYPTRDRFGRAVSLAFVVICGYLASMPVVYPWYYAPATFVGIIAFTRAATTLAFSASEQLAARPWLQRRQTWVSACLGLLAFFAVLLFFPASFKERVQQAEIEMGNRAEIGKWLKENAKPSDTVYLEPLGYIGYFSGLHVDDFPGLVSPKVVQLRRELHPTDVMMLQSARLYMIPRVQADWVVLRTNEYNQLSQLPFFEDFKKSYTLVKEFDVNKKLDKYPFLPGSYSLHYDAGFAVFHRNGPAT